MKFAVFVAFMDAVNEVWFATSGIFSSGYFAGSVGSVSDVVLNKAS
jgi:hypothetical protein